jgi:hypothetical protein
MANSRKSTRKKINRRKRNRTCGGGFFGPDKSKSLYDNVNDFDEVWLGSTDPVTQEVYTQYDPNTYYPKKSILGSMNQKRPIKNYWTDHLPPLLNSFQTRTPEIGRVIVVTNPSHSSPIFIGTLSATEMRQNVLYITLKNMYRYNPGLPPAVKSSFPVSSENRWRYTDAPRFRKPVPTYF